MENISNLITSSSIYQCRKPRLVHFVIHGRHTSMYMCALGIPKGKFLKQMKNKLSYRIIRIKRIFSGVYWCITWTKSLIKLICLWVNWSRLYICLWVNWSRLYINKLRKKCVYSYNKDNVTLFSLVYVYKDNVALFSLVYVYKDNVTLFSLVYVYRDA